MPPRKLWLQTRLPEFCASLWTKVFHPELSVKLKSGSALSHIGTLWRFNAVLDLVSDAKTHERAYNTPELQMVPRPSSICSKSHCEDQPWPVNADTRRIFHCFFFWTTTSPGGVMPQNTTKFCPHDKDIHSYKQEVSRHQTGHQVSTSLQVTCEEYNDFPPAFHLTGHGQLLNYPEPAYYQGALMFQNRTSTKKSSFAQPLPSPATLLPLELIASTSFLQLGW